METSASTNPLPRMSASSNIDDWIPFFQDTNGYAVFFHSQYTSIATATLLYYDCMITIKDQVKLVQERPFSLATVLYLIIRYGFLFLVTMTVALDMPVSVAFEQELTTSCPLVSRAAIVVQIAVYAAVSAFGALRIMALWSRNWLLGAFLFFLGLPNPTAMETSLLFGFSIVAVPLPLGGCLSQSDSRVTNLTLIYFPIIFSTMSVVYELLCLVLTLHKTLGNYRHGRAARLHTPLSSLIIRDGSLYFAVFTALAVLDISAGLAPRSKLPDGLIASFSRALTPIFITRFIIRIRQVDERRTVTTVDGPESTTGQDSDVVFAPRDRFLDSMSGELGDDSDEDASPLDAGLYDVDAQQDIAV
ncbi:hypothetical protein C8Q74DRAFT_1251440 [Fomes fomentarius]|nr:hypothetical protein C8Q74DRAFT_1251440 [Fomes fomentarius]